MLTATAVCIHRRTSVFEYSPLPSHLSFSNFSPSLSILPWAYPCRSALARIYAHTIVYILVIFDRHSNRKMKSNCFHGQIRVGCQMTTAVLLLKKIRCRSYDRQTVRQAARNASSRGLIRYCIS